MLLAEKSTSKHSTEIFAAKLSQRTCSPLKTAPISAITAKSTSASFSPLDEAGASEPWSLTTFSLSLSRILAAVAEECPQDVSWRDCMTKSRQNYLSVLNRLGKRIVCELICVNEKMDVFTYDNHFDMLWQSSVRQDHWLSSVDRIICQTGWQDEWSVRQFTRLTGSFKLFRAALRGIGERESSAIFTQFDSNAQFSNVQLPNR